MVFSSNFNFLDFDLKITLSGRSSADFFQSKKEFVKNLGS
jgi:hypothetical protein